RVKRRGVHSEIQIDDQVHLSLRSFGLHFDILDGSFGALVGDVVVMSSKIVLEEKLVTLCAGHQCVAAPDEPYARPVRFRAWLLDRERKLLLLNLANYVVNDLLVGLRP